MDINKILQLSSNKHSLYWRLEGFSTDVHNSIYVAPVLTAEQTAPPLLLLAFLHQQSHLLKTLQVASDYTNSSITVQEVEAIAQELISRLDAWTEGVDLSKLLKSITIGASFHFEESRFRGRQGVWLAHNHELEKRYLTVPRLESLWKDLSLEIPPIIELDDLQTIARLHDTISLVSLPNGKNAIFKGAIRIVARFYHELRELLRMPPHPNIAERPWYLVTRQLPGREAPVLCGFILKYYPGGSLLDVLSHSSIKRSLPWDTKIKWIRQILDVFRHIHAQPDGFYSDARLDNIVLDKQENIIFIDFEQYGSSHDWWHPSLWSWKKNMIQNTQGDESWKKSAVNPANMPKGMYYSNPKLGYLKCFVNATQRQREGWEAYTIAKLIWCIFEEETNQITLHNLDTEESQLCRDDGTPLADTIFPRFRMTPLRMRYWIWLCTKDSSEWGHLQCKCGSLTPDLFCPSEGVSPANTLASILDTYLYFEAGLLEEDLRSLD